MTNRDHALSYAARGWLVLPLDGKRPRTRHGVKDATADPAQIRAWWDRWPDAGIGIAAGNGIIILDIDPRNGGNESLAALEQEHKLPATVQAETGSGGAHYYLTHSGDKLGNRSNVRPGIDLKSDGGYVVAPPSKHPNGNLYRWIDGRAPGEIDLAPMPDWLLELVQSPATQIVGGFQLALAACRRMTMRDGKDGSRRLFAICCRGVEHNLTAEQIIGLVQEIGRDKPFPRQFSNEEIRKRIAHAEAKCERGSALVTKPRINCTSIDLDVVNRQCWSIIKDKNDPPTLFRYGGFPSRIEQDDKGQPIIRPATYRILRHHLAKWIHWYKISKTDSCEYPVAPPEDACQDILATPNIPLPVLERIVDAPVFGNDGSLLTEPGYHAAAQTYFVPSSGFELPRVPAQPSGEQVAAARSLIVDELLGDFPFTGDAERAHAVALLLLPFARSLIIGPTPFHLITKPAAGTGATLLVDAIHRITTGREIPTLTEASTDDEWRKRLTAKLRESPQYMMIDNIKLPLDSPALAAALTSGVWEDRILGISQVIRIPIRCVWLGTGNNVTMNDEIARRTVRIRLDARCDRPFLRTGFRHADLLAWATENRPALVHACLALIQAWIAAGRPEGKQHLGKFEAWSKAIGGILSVAEIPGFLGNLGDFYDDVDTAGAALRGFLSAWLATHGSTAVKAADLYTLILSGAELPLGAGSERSQQSRLGRLLAANKDRIFELSNDGGTATVRVDRAGSIHGCQTWRLTPVSMTIAA